MVPESLATPLVNIHKTYSNLRQQQTPYFTLHFQDNLNCFKMPCLHEFYQQVEHKNTGDSLIALF